MRCSVGRRRLPGPAAPGPFWDLALDQRTGLTLPGARLEEVAVTELGGHSVLATDHIADGLLGAVVGVTAA